MVLVMESHATLRGTSDYAVDRAHNWNYGQSEVCADCGEPISNGHERCRPCARRHRIMTQVTIPDERYLKPVPDGLRLIWYPRMAMSRRGKLFLRRQLKRQLRRYFARKQQEHTDWQAVHYVWVRDFR